jgi:Domain of unknown function (DUF4440)
VTDRVADELRDAERRRLAALVERDMAAAAALHAEDYQLITPGGATLTKRAYLSGIADGALRYRRFEPDGEIAVRVWGTAAAVRYRVRIDIDWEGGHDFGVFWHTDIYEHTEGRWLAVWSQATRTADDEPTDESDAAGRSDRT